jgi:hypothetical protein
MMTTNVHSDEALRLTRKDWIQTYTGLQFRPLSPDPAAVRIEDIAHALANKCRFTGHTTRFYSVAEHSVLVSSILPPELQLVGLLHDAGEAYLPDIASPIKRFVSVNGEPFSALEARVLRAVFKGLKLNVLGCELAESEEVKRADLAVLTAERDQIMSPPPADWHLTVPAADVSIRGRVSWLAETLFLERFKELTR